MSTTTLTPKTFSVLSTLKSQAVWLSPLIFGILLILFWEGALRVLSPENFLIPRPSEIYTAFFAEKSDIWSATKTTGFIMVTGLLGGVILGVIMSLLITLFRAANEALTPIAIAINAIPIVAVAPLFNNWVGLLSPRSNQAVVVLLVFFPVFITTAKGLTQVSREQIELMNSYAASKWTILKSVRIPNALPYFFTSLKIVSSLAVIAAIVVEYFGGRQDSLGSLIPTYAGFLQYAEAWATVVAGSIIGIGFYFIALLCEKIVLNRYIIRVKIRLFALLCKRVVLKVVRKSKRVVLNRYLLFRRKRS